MAGHVIIAENVQTKMDSRWAEKLLRMLISDYNIERVFACSIAWCRWADVSNCAGCFSMFLMGIPRDEMFGRIMNH